jgi:hypothetical protein
MTDFYGFIFNFWTGGDQYSHFGLDETGGGYIVTYNVYDRNAWDQDSELSPSSCVLIIV